MYEATCIYFIAIYCQEILCKYNHKSIKSFDRTNPQKDAVNYNPSQIHSIKFSVSNHAITHLLYCLYFSWIVEIVSLGVTDFYMQVLGFISRGNKLEHILYTKRQRAYWYTYRVQSQREFILILPSCLHIPAFAGCVLFQGKQKYD